MRFERQCKIILKKCLDIKRKDKILIVTDKNMQWLVDDLVETAFLLGNEVNVVNIPIPEVSGIEPPKDVAKKMLNYDFVIAPTSKSITHTKAVTNAMSKGVRVVTLPGINVKIMKQSILADYDRVEKFTFWLFKKLKGSKKISVTTKSGTDFKFSLFKREWHSDTGKIKLGGNLPGGEIFIAPLERSSNGKIVIDCFEKDGEIFARKGAEIIVKNGKAVDISDKKCKIAKLFDTVKNGRNIAEFGIGTNYKAKIIGNTLQDEKVLGTCHIAFGSNFSFGGRVRAGMHLDTILIKPTIKADGKVIMKDGRFT